jgi:hypothetical protein
MTKFKVPASLPSGAPGGPKAQPEPQQELLKPRERKPIHPGLDYKRRCLKCETFLVFREIGFTDEPSPLSRPFSQMWSAFCECGVWMMDQRGQIRWIRYSSGLVRPGDGEVFAP